MVLLARRNTTALGTVVAPELVNTELQQLSKNCTEHLDVIKSVQRSK